MTVSFEGDTLDIDGQRYCLEWPIRDAVSDGTKVFVLLDPETYLSDFEYKKGLRQGAPAIRNLIALAEDGRKLWEAEFPEHSDYYYRICSARPLIVNSFSSFRCEIQTDNGTIVRKTFFK